MYLNKCSAHIRLLNLQAQLERNFAELEEEREQRRALQRRLGDRELKWNQATTARPSGAVSARSHEVIIRSATWMP